MYMIETLLPSTPAIKILPPEPIGLLLVLRSPPKDCRAEAANSDAHTAHAPAAPPPPWNFSSPAIVGMATVLDWLLKPAIRISAPILTSPRLSNP